MIKCSACQKQFKNEIGLNIHFKRMHTPAGVSWGKGSRKKLATANRPKTDIASAKTRTRSGLPVRELIRQSLAGEPNGLNLSGLVAAMQQNGYKSVNGRGYVAKIASLDSGIKKTKDGNYVLKSRPSAAGTTVAEVEETVELPREALLLRIEMLSSLVRAVTGAHIGVVQELVRNA
jgi:hypothetical protein